MNYVSESFWDAATFLTILSLLAMFAAMCIPAIVARQQGDRRQGWISMLCGLTGMVIWVPWIVSVVQVTRKYNLPEKKKSAVPAAVFGACGLLLMLLGGMLVIRNNRDWGSLYGVSLVVYGAGLLVTAFLRGKWYWGGLMLMAPLLLSCWQLEITEALYRIYEASAIACSLLILYNVFRSCRRQEAVPTAESAPAQEETHAPKEAQRQLARCRGGHFYDRAQHPDGCPYCAAAESASAAAAPAQEEMPQQTPSPIAPQPRQAAELREEAQSAPPQAAPERPPVVGWLVCVKGACRGEGFPLKAGRNYIGRSAEMDIHLPGDDRIADVRQAAIIYDPRSRQFLVTPGEVRELCYLNNALVLSSTPMSAYDLLDMGSTSLMLIPCCGERFSWEETPDKDSE